MIALPSRIENSNTSESGSAVETQEYPTARMSTTQILPIDTGFAYNLLNSGVLTGGIV
jgi:hypothetical protein